MILIQDYTLKTNWQKNNSYYITMIKNINILFLLIYSLTIWAQSPKKALTPEDFALWKTLENQQISENGAWLAYESNPFLGDGALYLRNNSTGKTEIIPRGYQAKFAPNSEYIVFKIKPPDNIIKTEKLAKKKKEQLSKDSLGIIMLNNLATYKYPNLKSYALPEKKSDWFAFMIESEKDTAKTEGKEAENKKTKGIETGTLVIAQPNNKNFITFKKVSDYSVSKNGTWIGYITNTEDSVNTVRVNIYNTNDKSSFICFRGKGEAKKIAIDGNASQLAFIFSEDTIENKVFNLYFATENQKKSVLITDSTKIKLPYNYAINTHAEVYFSDDNKRLFFSTAPCIAHIPKDSIPEEDKVSLDLWSWTDTRLMSQQLKELEKDTKKTYLAVYDISLNKIYQLATEEVPDIRLLKKGSGRYALTSTAKPYELEASWEARSKKDYYVTDLEKGTRRKVLSAKEFEVSLSPEGNYIVYYESADSIWYVYNRTDNSVKALHSRVLSRFYNQDYDNPATAPPYGIAAWTEDDKTVLIYDKYDIWEFDPECKTAPRNITKDIVKGKIINRYVKLDKGAHFIKKNEGLLIQYTDEESRSEGFYTIEGRNRERHKIHISDSCRFTSIIKAKNSNNVIYCRSTFKEFGDLWLTDVRFYTPQKVTHINPQQVQYLWGSAEQYEWVFEKKTYKGLLYKPENFNPKKTYPMITYFYEKSSHTLHNHYGVTPGRSVINYPLYTSNGYLIFVPDINFEKGKPGESALNTVLSGVYSLIEKGFVDQNRLGIHGQSWGGYLTAYIITRTPIFKAAMAGAPVSNMTSAYAAIRTETGINRIHQYEAGQSRIGATLWERRDLYIENSPLFYADKIQTPLLIMANDNDGAVPWTQGLELFLSMRRLQKPVWLLNYNNDEHNLTKKPNRIDLSKRMFQFFNTYLKNEPMPDWIKKGIPAKDKGKTLGY